MTWDRCRCSSCLETASSAAQERSWADAAVDRAAKLSAATGQEGETPLEAVVREASERFDARPLYRASVEARAELGSPVDCGCWQADARHIDPDGHLPACPHSYWMELRSERATPTAQRDTALELWAAACHQRDVALRALRSLLDAFPELRKSYATAEQQEVLRAAQDAVGGEL